MRLIDADALVAKIWEEHKKTEYMYDLFVDELKGIFCGIVSLIDEQPTAYDLDKVVEQLSCNECGSCELRDVCNDNMLDVFMIKICEIIKRGGVDGN